MNPARRPCFTQKLLQEIRSFQEEFVREYDQAIEPSVKYLVLASAVPGVFNLGGDLKLFKQLIRSKDREGLFNYATSCIDVLYANLVSLKRDITTISLVQGSALGGGFEAAMSANVLIAEQCAKFGLPEIVFNLFPGMGAYSILSRKIGAVKAERMILSGKIYTASELHVMGIVDIVVENGQGETAVKKYIKKNQKSRNGFQALQEAKRIANPITYEELISITKVWADAALKVTDRDLRMMERLVSRQLTQSCTVN